MIVIRMELAQLLPGKVCDFLGVASRIVYGRVYMLLKFSVE